MDYGSIRRGAAGNTKLLKAYGGGSTGPRQGYATGGMVKAPSNPSLAEGLSAAGGASKPSLARPGRKVAKKGDKGKKGTQVNIVIAQPPKEGAQQGPSGVSPPPQAAAMAGPPMPPPPGPPPMMGPPPGAGPGGPPMLPRAHGGRIMRAKGGAVKRSVGGPASPPRGFKAGAGGGLGRLQKIKDYGK